MMKKTAEVKVRVNPEVKTAAVLVLSKLGLTMSEAVSLLLVQITLQQGLPFEINIPNEETKKALEETDKGIGLVKCKDRDDLFKQLGI